MRTIHKLAMREFEKALCAVESGEQIATSDIPRDFVERGFNVLSFQLRDGRELTGVYTPDTDELYMTFNLSTIDHTAPAGRRANR